MPRQPLVPRLRRGRPRKFASPSRAVTLTLPVSVLDSLRSLDPDLSRAVARLAQPEVARRSHPPAELEVWGRHAVILVNPSRTLEERTGVGLVPLPDGRALISFDRAVTIPQLALAIEDVLDDAELPEPDRLIFEAIKDILKAARRARGIVLQQRNIIVLEATTPTALSGGAFIPKSLRSSL